MTKPNLKAIAKSAPQLIYRPQSSEQRGALTNGHWLLMTSPVPTASQTSEEIQRRAEWDEEWWGLRDACCAKTLCPPEFPFRVTFGEKSEFVERAFGDGDSVKLPDFARITPDWPDHEYVQVDPEEARCAVRRNGIESLGFKAAGRFVYFAAAYAIPVLAAGLQLHVKGRFDAGVLTLDGALVGLIMPVRESPQGEIFEENPADDTTQTAMTGLVAEAP